MIVRRLGGLALAVLSLAVVGAGLAWACTPSAQLTVDPGQARAGQGVEVRGTSYIAGQAVRIRWNGPEGRMLRTVDVPDDRNHFTTSVRIPADAAPGAYTIIGIPASGVKAFGANRGTAGRAPIRIRPAPTPGTPPVGGQPNRPGSGQPDRPGNGQPNRPDRGRSPGARDIRGRGDRVPAISIPSIPHTRSAPGLGAGRAGFPDSQAPKSSRSDPSPSPGTTPSGTTPGGMAPGDRQADAKSGGRNAWKGRRAGEAPSLTPDRDEEAATEPGPSTGLAIGAGLLGFGLVALFAGFAVAEVRRRRLAVHPSHRTPE